MCQNCETLCSVSEIIQVNNKQFICDSTGFYKVRGSNYRYIQIHAIHSKPLQTKLSNFLSVPVGFIYVQLPYYPSPDNLWPHLVWQSVTERFAGLFFRAEGGNSNGFGVVQAETTNQISLANYGNFHDGNDRPVLISIPDNGEYSEYVRAGYWTPSTADSTEGLRFATSGAETRPINTAVKIWERI